MTIDRRLLAGAIGLAIGLAACGGAASPAATTAPTTASETEAPATAAPVESQPAAEPSEGISLPGGMNELAGMLPAEAAGTPYDRVGYNGDQLGVYGAAAGLSDTELAPLLEQFGKTINDVNFAIATPTGGGSTAMVYALQIEGVDSSEWLDEINLDPADFETRTIGGKEVLTQGAGGFNVYAYPKGDAVFVLILGDDTLAESVFSQLP